MFEDYEITELPKDLEYKPLFPKYQTSLLNNKKLIRSVKIAFIAALVIFSFNMLFFARNHTQPIVEPATSVKITSGDVKSFISEYFNVNPSDINNNTVFNTKFGIPAETLGLFYEAFNEKFGTKIKNTKNIFTVGDLISKLK